MIKLKEIGLNLSEKEYRDLDHLSSTFLSKFSRIGKEILTDTIDNNDGITFGRIVDEYTSGTHNKNNYYTISGEAIIGDKLKEAIDIISKNIDHSKIKDNSEYYNKFVKILTDIPDIPYYSKKEADWRAKKILSEGKEYFESILKSRNKIIVNFDLYNKAINTGKLILNHQFTKEIFKIKKNQEGVFQFQYVFHYLGENMKGMLDWIVIDHNKKTIKAYDIKTGKNDTEKFEIAFYYWRYDIQALLYTIICKYLVKRWYNNYTILPFTFIYSGRNDNGKVLKYEIDKSHLIGARDGYVKNNKKYKGVIEILKDLKWYKDNNFKVDYTENIYNSNGIIKLEPLTL